MRKYLLTHLLFPIENPIQLSKKLDLSLDNLRNEEEIKRLKNFIEVSMDSDDEIYNRPGHKMRLPKVADEGIVSVEWGLRDFAKKYNQSEYITKFFEENQTDDYWDLISRMWVVLRIGDNSEIYNSLYNYKIDKLFYLEDESPAWENAINYSYILSLLISKGDEDYNGRTFLLPNLDHLIDFPEPNVYLNGAIFYFCGINVVDYSPSKSEEFFDLASLIEPLKDKANKIEKILDIESAKKLLYIGNLLKAADNRHIDSRLKFNTLVSIMELLLTHNPDYNRFNVEDSISKQFRLKTSILAYIEDPEINLDEMRNNLKDIYDQRSNIAHGNFNEFYKYLVKGKSKDSIFSTKHFHKLMDNLYDYVRICVNQYIQRRKFVEFLKKN